MPYDTESDEKKDYTVEEMADYLAREVSSGEELLSVLAEHGFELTPSEMPSEEPLEMADEMLEEGEEEEVADEEAEAMGGLEEMMPPMPPMPEGGKPQLNIVAARFRAADNALKKGAKGKGSNERG